MGLILVIIGAILAVVGGIWLLIEAFKEHILWGLGGLFINIVLLIFVIVHWDKAKRPFGYLLLGWVLIIIGAVISPRRDRLGFNSTPTITSRRV